MKMDAIFNLLEVGFPIASALAGGFFVFLTLRFILDGALSDIKTQRGFVKGLDERIKTMNNELIRIDSMINHVFHLKPDLTRLSRSDGQKDARKD